MFKNVKIAYKDMTTDEIYAKRDLDLILKQNTQVLALFCSSWCPFCRSFFPSFNRAMAKYTFERVIRVYLEDDYNPLWDKYSIEAVPTIILFEKSQISSRIDATLGAGLDDKQFKEWLSETAFPKLG